MPGSKQYHFSSMVIISSPASFSQGTIRLSKKMRGKDSPFSHVSSNLQHLAQIHEPDRDQQQLRANHLQDYVFNLIARRCHHGL
jgi:hypothetical protein